MPLYIGLIVVSIIYWMVVTGIFSQMLNLDGNLSILLPVIVVLYFWANFLFLNETQTAKIIGIILLAVGVLLNLIAFLPGGLSQTQLIMNIIIFGLTLIGAGLIFFLHPPIIYIVLGAATVVLLGFQISAL